MIIRVLITRDGSNQIEKMNLEDYVKGVVPSEMSYKWPVEALKAQAVAARTYAMYHMNKNKKKSYDVDDTSSKYQAYVPSKIHANTTAAVIATKGQYLSYKDKPINAVFCSSNGGTTVSAKSRWGSNYPYLIAKEDPYTKASGRAKDSHGVGMSQYGAKEAASIGLHYDQILSFYYPGTILTNIEEPIIEGKESPDTMNYKRVLKQGMSGTDVRYMKDLIFELGYYKGISKINNSTFGKDTTEAVKKFQSSNKDTSGNKLTVDGIIGKKTWDAVVKASSTIKTTTEHPLLDSKDYPNISEKALKDINSSLEGITDARYEIVKTILPMAYDREKGGEIRGLYMWGGNLYNTNLSLNIATEAKIQAGAKAYPSYYNNGRKEMMLDAVKKNPNLPAADCSGMEVGYLRKFKYVKANFDTSANSLCSASYSTSIKKSELKPGDWVGFSGHIGTYVGGGYVVEFAGGAYGCQLTELNDRRLYSFVTKKTSKGTAWNNFRDPKYY